MTVIRFPGVRVRRTKRGACPVCGKPAVRSALFEQTVNPYNRNPDGAPKTYPEVVASVSREADRWVPDFTHDKCATPA